MPKSKRTTERADTRLQEWTPQQLRQAKRELRQVKREVLRQAKREGAKVS
jgi:hypothetical protein